MDTQTTAPFGSQGKLYKVRDIINEKGNKYLIDWEDDAETGEKYQPTWVSMVVSYLKEGSAPCRELTTMIHILSLLW